MQKKLYGKIVRNENNYVSLDKQYKVYDMTTLYSELMSDISLMNMGDTSDIAYQQFYAAQQADNTGKFDEAQNLIKDGDIAMAMSKNNNKLNTKSDVQDFKVSPNPANNFIIAEYKIDKAAKEVLLLISDMQGRLLMKKQLTTISNQALIDIRNLQNGSYNCVTIVDGQQKAVTKLIIQH